MNSSLYGNYVMNLLHNFGGLCGDKMVAHKSLTQWCLELSCWCRRYLVNEWCVLELAGNEELQEFVPRLAVFMRSTTVQTYV